MNDQVDTSGALRTLSRLSTGEHTRVRDIVGGSFMTQRIGMLGIRPGTEIRVVHGPNLRGVVLQVGGARIALGRGILEHIRVDAQSAPELGTDAREDRS